MNPNPFLGALAGAIVAAGIVVVIVGTIGGHDTPRHTDNTPPKPGRSQPTIDVRLFLVSLAFGVAIA